MSTHGAMATSPDLTKNVGSRNRYFENTSQRSRKKVVTKENMLGESPVKATDIRRLLDISLQMREINIDSALKEYEELMKNSNLEELFKKEDNYFTRTSRQRQVSGEDEDVSKLRNDLLEKENEIQKLREEQKNWMDSLQKLEFDIKSENQQLNLRLENREKELKKTKQQLEDSKSKLEEVRRSSSNIGATSTVENFQQYTETLKKKLQETEEKLQQKINEHSEWLETMNTMKMETNECNVKLRTQLEYQKQREDELCKLLKLERTKTKTAEIAKSEALTRLSREMGTKLNDNNPTIADLSDPNRATKLAEMYNELYDNEWTDALEVLEKTYDEEVAIRCLLEIVKKVFAFCCEKSEDQMKDIENIFFTQNLDGKVTNMRETEQQKKMIMKMLKDYRKSTAENNVEQIYEEYSKRFDKSSVSHWVPEYVKKVVKICWLMNVQDPPVCLGKEAKPYSALDTNIFKAYTKSGTTVSYTVWLPLYLNEGGPLLSKGVAQPMPIAGKSRPYTAPVGKTNHEKDAPLFETMTIAGKSRPYSAHVHKTNHEKDPTLFETRPYVSMDKYGRAAGSNDYATVLADYTKQSALEARSPILAWEDKTNVHSTTSGYDSYEDYTQGNYDQTYHAHDKHRGHTDYSVKRQPTYVTYGKGIHSTDIHMRDFNRTHIKKQYEQSTIQTKPRSTFGTATRFTYRT